MSDEKKSPSLPDAQGAEAHESSQIGLGPAQTGEEFEKERIIRLTEELDWVNKQLVSVTITDPKYISDLIVRQEELNRFLTGSIEKSEPLPGVSTASPILDVEGAEAQSEGFQIVLDNPSSTTASVFSTYAELKKSKKASQKKSSTPSRFKEDLSSMVTKIREFPYLSYSKYLINATAIVAFLGAGYIVGSHNIRSKSGSSAEEGIAPVAYEEALSDPKKESDKKEKALEVKYQKLLSGDVAEVLGTYADRKEYATGLKKLAALELKIYTKSDRVQVGIETKLDKDIEDTLVYRIRRVLNEELKTKKASLSDLVKPVHLEFSNANKE